MIERYGAKGFASRLKYTYLGAPIVIAPAGTAQIPFGNRWYDSLDEYDLGGASTFTPRHAGYYLVNASAMIGMGAGAGMIILYFNCSNPNQAGTASMYCAGGLLQAPNVTHLLYMTPADNLGIWIVNNTANNINVLGLLTATQLNIHRLS